MQTTSYLRSLDMTRSMIRTKLFIATMEAVKRELLGQYALTQEIKDIQAAQEECEAYYNEHKAMFVKEAKATAKHILTETEEESKKVLEEIESGAKDI